MAKYKTKDELAMMLYNKPYKRLNIKQKNRVAVYNVRVV